MIPPFPPAEQLIIIDDRSKWNKLYERLWSLLPDRCQVDQCARKNVRGNENVVKGVRMCDDCDVDYHNGLLTTVKKRRLY